MRTVGGTIGAQMSAAFLTTFTVGGTALPAEKGFTLTFLVAGIVATVGLAAVFLVPKHAPATHEPLRDAIPRAETAGEGVSA